MKKMNNKGFSLVELIVVVLIMAIIAVALAPQVMKWVENSRVSTDCTNYESMIENLQLAISDKEVYKEISAEGVTGYTKVVIDDKKTAIDGCTAASQSVAITTMPTHTASGTPTATTICDFINWSLSKIDASWAKIAKKASGTVSGKDAADADQSNKNFYEIKVEFGKQANVKRTGLSPETLKNGTDLS